MSDDVVGVRVFNLPEFSARLKALGDKVQRQIVRSGVAAALQVMKRAVKSNAPKGKTGTLKRSLYVKRSKISSRPGLEYGIVRPYTSSKGKIKRGGARAVAKALRQDAFYWRFVEAGHIARGPGNAIRGGTRRRRLTRERLLGAKFVEGRWFIRDSFSQVKSAAISAFNARVEQLLIRENYRGHIR